MSIVFCQENNSLLEKKDFKQEILVAEYIWHPVKQEEGEGLKHQGMIREVYDTEDQGS